MAQVRSLGEGPLAGYAQVLLHLKRAQAAADQLGDTSSVALIETLQQVYRVRAGTGGALELPPQPAIQEHARASSLTVNLFGVCRVWFHGRLITGWRKKSEALFKFLVFHHPTPVHREQLIELFWPEADPQSARNCLNVTLHALRRSLSDGTEPPGGGLIHFANEQYSLITDIDIWTDVDSFSEQVAQGRAALHRDERDLAILSFEAATALYGGDFLETDRYEDWAISPRERLRSEYLALLADLGRLYLATGNAHGAIDCARKVLERDTCDEEAYRQLMRAYCAFGQRSQALRQFQTCATTLAHELGITPMDETVRLYEQIKHL